MCGHCRSQSDGVSCSTGPPEAVRDVVRAHACVPGQRKKHDDKEDAERRRLQASRRRDLKTKFYSKAMQESVHEYHMQVWPGVAIPESPPYRMPNGPRQNCLPERTSPTSVLVSCMACYLGEESRRKKTAHRAHEFLACLVSLLAASGQWNVVCTELRDFQQQECRVHANGTIAGDCICGSGEFPRKLHLLDLWQRELAPWC